MPLIPTMPAIPARPMIAFAILLVSIGVVLGQTEKQIAAIRSEVALITREAPRYAKRTSSVEDVSLEGTEATYFSSRGTLRKVTARIYGETFRATAELFYKGGELIFAFQRLEGYDTHIAADPPPKVSKIVETRVYYADGRAIRVIEGKKQLVNSSEEFRGADQGMKDLSDKVKAAFKP